MNKSRVIGAAMVAAFAFTAAPANAGTGCNGVWNIFVWGCAPWDNNNGPQFPYFKKREIVVPVPRAGTGIKVTVNGSAAMARVNGQDMPIKGGVQGLVAAGGGNLVAAGGGNLVAAGGGNLSVWSQN